MEGSDSGWVGRVGVPSRDFLTYHFNFLILKVTLPSVDKDLGFNFTGGGYSNELKQIVNCVKQNWDGSSFLGRLDQQEDILWSMG